MIEKLKLINWWKYFKIVGIYSGIILFSKISPAKDAVPLSWTFIILLILFIMLAFFAFGILQATLELEKKQYLNKTKAQILSDTRKKKLKKLSRKWL